MQSEEGNRKRRKLVGEVVFRAQLTPKNNIWSENKLQCISLLFIPQDIIPRVFFFFFLNTTQIISTISKRKPRRKKKFQSLFTFRGHSTQEPASIVRNFYHRDLFYSASPHRNRCQPQPTQKILEGGFGNMQVNGSDGQKSGRKKSLEVSVACMAIHRPTPDFKGRTFKLCVLTRRDFNFCVRSFTLQG